MNFPSWGLGAFFPREGISSVSPQGTFTCQSWETCATITRSPPGAIGKHEFSNREGCSSEIKISGK